MHIPFHLEGLATKRARIVTAMNALLDETSGRARSDAEQRSIDDLDSEITRIDAEHHVMVARHQRDEEIAPQRAAFDAFFNGGAPSGHGFGQLVRDAIDEVKSGKASAYVDFPTSTRALAESGSGGYGVPTVIAAPVYSLAARSAMLSLPGVIKVDVTTGDRWRMPRFNAVSVAGTAEAAALNAANTDLDAVDVVFQKFSTYETLSTELEEDFSAPALDVLGQRMLKDLAARVDQGLIQGNGAADVVGLFNQSGVSTTSVGALPADFDKVAEAVYQLEPNDGTPGAWLMHPRSWRIYKQIKTGIASDKTTLLQPDPALDVKSLAGLPVFTTSSISITSGATSVGSTAALVDPSQLVIVTRRPPRLEISRDVAFATDQVAIRATTRIGLGVIDPAGGVSLLTDIRIS